MQRPSFNGVHTQPSAPRTISVASNFKFENVQKLNTLVGQIGNINKQTAIRSVRAGMSDKVIDLIKNRIKSNYDKLYQNYDVNKKTILRQIQHVQTNLAGQNSINKGFENVIKQKAHYDKLKSQIQAKQKKLKKMVEMRDHLKQIENSSGDLSQILEQKCSLFQNLDQYRQNLDYQTAVLNNLKDERRKIKLQLKQRYDNMLKEEQLKKHKIQKLIDGNHNKKIILSRIQQTLKKQQQCEIPQNLAEQLQRKLQQYEGKQTYDNIIKHQTILNEERQRKLQQQIAHQKSQQRRQKLEKQKQDKKQYEIAYNFFLIKQAEQQKIKKICGVSNLGEIVNNSLQSDYENLQTIRRQIEASIIYMKTENKNIENQIQNILTNKIDYSTQNLESLQKQLQEQEVDLRSYKNSAQKKTKLMIQWQSIIQLISKKSTPRQQIPQMLKQTLKEISQSKIAQQGFRKFSLQQKNHLSVKNQGNNKYNSSHSQIEQIKQNKAKKQT